MFNEELLSFSRALLPEDRSVILVGFLDFVEDLLPSHISFQILACIIDLREDTFGRRCRELDALVKDVGSHHGRRRGGRGNSGQELLGGSKDCSSSDGSSIGEDRRQERLGIAVWRGGSGRQYFTLWWGLKW